MASSKHRSKKQEARSKKPAPPRPVATAQPRRRVSNLHHHHCHGQPPRPTTTAPPPQPAATRPRGRSVIGRLEHRLQRDPNLPLWSALSHSRIIHSRTRTLALSHSRILAFYTCILHLHSALALCICAATAVTQLPRMAQALAVFFSSPSSSVQRPGRHAHPAQPSRGGQASFRRALRRVSGEFSGGLSGQARPAR